MQFIESIQNQRVKHWKKLLTKKEREKSQQFMVEGFHLVEEAMMAGVVEDIILGDGVEPPSFRNTTRINFYKVTKEVIKEISETETTQGIFAVCKMQEQSIDPKTFQSLLLIDGIQDPGNLGTIVRTADAAGIRAIVLGDGTTDLYNPKTIRATQGSLFHLPIVKANIIGLIPELKKAGITILGTALQNAKKFTDVEKPTKVALIVGNEGKGVSKELLTMTDQNVFIPIYGKAESLNVGIAAGILMYHFRK
ncbi:MAG: methyltransferase [Bacillales bacterium]|jgi:TrmH family RNA methyltransferase|nr:methyltransferase [Bacillales bacterium]